MMLRGSAATRYLLGFAVLLAVAFAEEAKAEDCARAREVYRHGTTLLNYAERREAFQKAVDLCPSFAEAHVNLADALEHLARIPRELSQAALTSKNDLFDKAIGQYRKALELNRNLFASHLGLAETYATIGLYKKAEDAFKKALALRPDDLRAVWGLEGIREAIAEDLTVLKVSDEIVSRVKDAPSSSKIPTMGFAGHTVAMDRVRFNNILFDPWSAELRRGEALQQMREIGKALSASDLTAFDFVVEGHTDNRGGYERNMKLSRDRAAAVKTYLVRNYNVDRSRVKTQGFGYSRPRFPNDTSEHRLKNRRVELLFIRKTNR